MNPRKSDDLHELNGTLPSDGGTEAVLPSSRPRCPKALTPEERKIFRNMCRELEKRRALTSGDAEILRLLAVIQARHQRAIEHLAKEGELVTYTRLDKKGEAVDVVSKNLWLGIAQDTESKITALLDRLGMTPMNRPRIRPTKEEQSNIKFY